MAALISPVTIFRRNSLETAEEIARQIKSAYPGIHIRVTGADSQILTGALIPERISSIILSPNALKSAFFREIFMVQNVAIRIYRSKAYESGT